MQDEHPWYHQRAYAHFDRRPTRSQVIPYVKDPTKVVRHGFFPFIMRPVRICHFGEHPSGKRRHTYKVRPITYAAHMDTHIHAYYAFQLGRLLEGRLRDATFNTGVLAYRKFPSAKCNIDFALETFQEVLDRGDVDVLAIDVKGFFDNLDHAILKASWCDLLGVDRLAADHYAVFRSVTRDYAVEWPKVRRALRERYRRRAGRTGEPICTLQQFRKLIVPLLERRCDLVQRIKSKSSATTCQSSEGDLRGIPQGSAISAVLANLYMFDADAKLHRKLSDIGASYRRYSDDILVIGPPGSVKAAEKLVREALAEVSLSINEKKTERLAFRLKHGHLRAFSQDDKGVVDHTHRKRMQYLGLFFDGERIRLRDTTVSRYLIRMNRSVRGAEKAAKARGIQKIRRRKLYATLSRLGAGDAYGRWCVKDGVLRPPDHAPRPGFLSYSQRAAKKDGEGSEIERQNARLWHQLHLALRRAEGRLRRDDEHLEG